MPRYVFTSNQGRFLIPDGESRIGSDSSCPVCVRGDGILPVHAYLKLDGNKLTLRPSSEKAAVLVDGKLLAGPETIALGQLVVIGPMQLKLESESGPGKPFWHRRWVRGTVYAASAVLALVLLALLLRLVWFNDAWFKAKITAQIQSALMREEAEIERVDVSLLDGTLAIHNLRVENNMAFLAKGDLLKVERIDGSLNAWDFLSSWIQGTPEITSGKLNVVRPKIFIELNDRGLSNVDDILREYLTVQQPRLKPFDLGLASLDAQVNVEDGLVQINDEYTGTGISALEGLNIDVTQKGFADNLKVVLSAKTNAGTEARGTIALDLAFRLINPRGEIATDDIGDGTAQLTFESVDFGRICRHLRLDLPVYGDDKTELKLVPGKPATGEFAVNFHDLKQFHVNGDLKSESLVSVIERDKPSIGNLPAYLEIKTLNYDLQKGPLNMDVTLRGAKTLASAMNPAADHILTLTAEGKHNSGGEYAYSSRYELKLADFGETDVGQRLGLRDALKGTLSGTLTQVRELKEGKRSLSIDATMGLSSDAQVLVGAGPNAVWQPCRFAVGLKADAKPNDAGELDSLLAEFSAKSDSFLVKSLKPMKVTSLDNLTALSIDSRFHLALKGREFTKEFQPILALMNLRVPEEVLDLDVMVLTDRGEDEEIAELRGQRRIRLGIEGKAERQWKEQTSPQSLFLMLRYLPELHQAAQRARAGDVAAAKHPYLKLEFLTEAKEQDPIKIHVTNATVRGAGDQVILSIPHEIESNLLAVHERYHPYLERIFSSLGPPALEAYHEHVLAGFLKQKGEVTVAYTPAAGPDSRPDLEVAFNLTTSGKDLAIEGPVPGTTLQQKKRWNWTEPAPDVTLKGRYVSRPASTKEEQDIQRLDLEKVEVKQSRIGQFNLTAGEVDLWLIGQLANHARLRKVWPDALGTFHFEGTVKEDAFRLLQLLNLLPPAPDVAGTLKLDVDFDRKQDRVKLNPFIYRLAEAPAGAKGAEVAFWFKEASMAADFRNVRKFFEDMDAQQANPLMHLGQRLTVKSITLDAPGFVAWTQNFPEQAKLCGLPPSLLESLRAQTFVPREQWLVRNFALTPGPNENSWSLLGQFKTPFYVKFPFIGADEKYPPVLVVAGDWSIDESDAAGLSLTKDFENPTLYLGANFERTGIALRNLIPGWDYQKPAEQLLKLTAHGSYSPGKGPIADVYDFKTLKLQGGPLEFDLGGINIKALRAAEGIQVTQAGVKSATVTSGPLPFSLENLAFDRAKNRFAAKLTVPKLDLANLPKSLLSSPDLKRAIAALELRGILDTVKLSYDGQFDRLLSMTPEPGADAFEISGQASGLQLHAAPTPQRDVVAEANGDFLVTATEVKSKKLGVSLRHSIAGAKGKPGVPELYRFTASDLWISTLDPKQSLLAALKAESPPVKVKLPIVAEDEMLDLDRFSVALDTLAMAFHGQGQLAEPPPDANPYRPLGSVQLVESSLSAPGVRVAGEELKNVSVPGLEWKDLVLGIKTLRGRMAGGELEISGATYDFKSATTKNPDWIEHKQKIALSRADLTQLLAPYMDTNSYKVAGDLSLASQGPLSLRGIGFAQADRRSWNGAFIASFSNVVVRDPEAKAQSKSSGFNPLGIFGKAANFLGDKFSIVTGKNSFNIDEILKDNPLLKGSAASINGMFMGLQLAMGQIGIDTSRLEFEPFDLTINIINGVADIRSSQPIKAKGANQGLVMSMSGKLDLATNRFDPDAGFKVWPTSLPPASHELLQLQRWPPEVRNEFLGDLAAGNLAMTLTGSASSPTINFPRDKLRSYVTRAAFNQTKVESDQDLLRGLDFLRGQSFGQSEDGMAGLARLFEMTGVAMPGTDLASSAGGANIATKATSGSALGNTVGQKQPTQNILRRMILGPEPEAPPKTPDGGKTTQDPKKKTPPPPPPPPPPPDDTATKKPPKEEPKEEPVVVDQPKEDPKEEAPEKPSPLDEVFDLLDSMRRKGQNP